MKGNHAQGLRFAMLQSSLGARVQLQPLNIKAAKSEAIRRNSTHVKLALERSRSSLGLGLGDKKVEVGRENKI